MPFFSIIIPLYNKEKFIEKTIQSALNQTFLDFELIIVNDGSTDGSLELVKVFKDRRIKIYTIPNGGVSKARNFGIQKANANLIALLDADDLWKSSHLEELYNLRNAHPNCGLYAMGYTKKFDNANPINAHFFMHENYNGIVPDFFSASTVDCLAWTSAVMIPKEIFKNIGYFNEGLKSGQDTEMWIRIALDYKVAFCSNKTACKVLCFDENHLSISEHKIDRLKIFEKFYDSESKHSALKKYLDLNRFSIAVDRKINGDFKNYKLLKKSILKKNLNLKQRLMLECPKVVLIGLKKIQRQLIQQNIYLTAFKN
jgi:glycosyltransferase involved in cell wall biosynthesis